MSDFTEPNPPFNQSDPIVKTGVNIRVLHDQTFGELVMALAAEYPSLQRELDLVSHIPPLEVGSIVYGVEIDTVGRAHFVRTEYGEPWYLPAGWYEEV